MRFATPRMIDVLVFLLLLSGPPKLRVRDATASLRGETDAVVLLRLVVGGAGGLWIAARLYPFLVARGVLPRLALSQILSVVLLAVLSLGVFVAPGPGLTAFSIYQLAVMMGVGWLFARLYGPDVFLKYLFWGYLVLGVLVMLAWVFMPELVVRRGRLRGDLIAPTGAIAALGLVLCLSGAIRMKKWLFWFASAVFSILLIASQTRTALAAFCAAAAVALLFRYPAPIRKVFPLGVVALLLAGILDLLSVGGQFAVREEQSLATMSDRLPLWEHLLGTMMVESPVIGLGYFSASRILGPEYNPGLGNAHSAFVEVMVGGGLVGGMLFFALYGVLVVYGVRLLLRARDYPVAYAVLGLFVITFLMSVTNTEGIQGGPIGFTFWSVTALLPAALEHRRQPAGVGGRTIPTPDSRDAWPPGRRRPEVGIRPLAHHDRG